MHGQTRGLRSSQVLTVEAGLLNDEVEEAT